MDFWYGTNVAEPLHFPLTSLLPSYVKHRQNFFCFFPSLLVTKNLQNHFFFFFVVKFHFLASKKNADAEGGHPCLLSVSNKITAVWKSTSLSKDLQWGGGAVLEIEVPGLGSLTSFPWDQPIYRSLPTLSFWTRGPTIFCWLRISYYHLT